MSGAMPVPLLAALAAALPLLAACGCALNALVAARRGAPLLGDYAASDAAERPTARLAQGAGWLALLLLLGADIGAWRDGAPGAVAFGTWFAGIGVGVLLDPLALALATLVAAIGALTLRFADAYLHREPGYHRFHAALCLFLAGMQLIVLGGNLVLVFVGWELAGLASYLLIGYAWDRAEASVNAQFAFVANRIGDAGFLLAIVLAYLWLGGVEWHTVSVPGIDPLTARLIAVGLATAALAKSAQLPFTAWIARALEGPTPSSAIFYGAVMVHAGVYLLIRAEPLLVQVPDALAVLAVLGAMTTVYCALTALAQTDVKSALVFATVAQVGLMFLACGLGFFALAAWHLGAHAAWRAYQFLMAPSILELAARPARPAPRWLARCRWLHGAALQRFWLDGLTRALVVMPLRALGADARRLDEEVIGPLAGAPRPDAAEDAELALLASPGAVGHALRGLAERFQAFENRLLWRGGDGPAMRLLRRCGDYLLAAEALLEQPRYLLILVVATFVVIL